MQSRPGRQGGPDRLPLAAWMPDTDEDMQVWVNNKGKEKTKRKVVGEKVLIRRQPAGPPQDPQVLILTDQMLDRFSRPDRYLHVLAMVGYSLKDYIRDVQDELINLQFPCICIFLGTLQLECLMRDRSIKK